MILIQIIKTLVIEKKENMKKKINNVGNDVLVCDFY